MFEASVDGQAYDPDRWAAYYKPSGFTGSGNAKPVASAPTPTPVPTPTQSASNDADSDDAPVESAPATSAPATGSDSGKRAEDILAMIRNRQK